MKTFTTTLLSIAFISIMFISDCIPTRDPKHTEIYHSEADTEAIWHNEKESNVIENETIIRFDTSASEGYKDSVLNETNNFMKIIDSCGCGDLYLFRHDPSFINSILDPEDRLASAEQQAGQEGDAFYNLEIFMDTLLGTRQEKAFNTKYTNDDQEFLVVAVIDGGLTNQDFIVNNLWVNKVEAENSLDDDNNCQVDDINGFNFVSNMGSSSSQAINMHGSVISYILLNTISPTQKIKLMDLMVFDQNGKGNLFDAICAIDYATKMNVDFINLSWGYYRDINDPLAVKSDSLLLEFINRAGVNNITVFASAGNKNEDTDKPKMHHFPSGFYSSNKYEPENLISVTSLDPSLIELDNEYANEGKKSVFIATKGQHYYQGNIIEGTSYATPFALGSTIEFLNSNQTMTPLGIKQCLESNSINKGFNIKTQGLIDTNAPNCP
jgi:hypothetical protein